MVVMMSSVKERRAVKNLLGSFEVYLIIVQMSSIVYPPQAMPNIPHFLLDLFMYFGSSH